MSDDINITNARLLLRRGTKDDLSIINPILKEGEPVLEYETVDSNGNLSGEVMLKVGDGVHSYNDLEYLSGSGGGSVAVNAISFNSYYKLNSSTSTEISTTNKSLSIGDGNSLVSLRVVIGFNTNIDKYSVIHNGSTIIELSKKTNMIETNIIGNNQSIQKSDKYTIKAYLKNNEVYSQDININFIPYIYYGISDTNKNIDLENPSSTLSRSLITSKNFTTNGITCTDKYVILYLPVKIYPTNYSPIISLTGSLPGGFTEIENTNTSKIYRVFISENTLNLNNNTFDIK